MYYPDFNPYQRSNVDWLLKRAKGTVSLTAIIPKTWLGKGMVDGNDERMRGAFLTATARYRFEFNPRDKHFAAFQRGDLLDAAPIIGRTYKCYDGKQQ